jgi:glycosyltransferase involved in cell wall biosynthesis
MLGRGETGNETYVAGLLQGLVEIGRPQAVAVTDAPADLCGHRIVGLSSTSDVRRLLVELPQAARRLGVRVLHCTYFAPPAAPCATVVTVHDVSFLRHPEWFTARDRAVLNAGVRLAARRATRIVVPSAHARAELTELLKVPEERIVVTSEATAPHFAPVPEERAQATARRYGIRGPYVLTVGNLQPRKNLRRLLRAWRVLVAAGEHHDCRLVLAGGLHGREEPLADLLADPSIVSTVVLPGHVPNDDLPALYSGAQALVFPSLYEGFGLPVLEAMACGAPVACSNAASLPEVAGDTAAFFDPLDVDGLAVTLSSLLADARLRAALRERGLAHARAFTWAACAQATLEAYEAAVAEHSVRQSPWWQPLRFGRPNRAAGTSGTPLDDEARSGLASTPTPPPVRPLRMALVGTRGVPAAYSGFETAVENLGMRLAARGHDVVVYCRPHMVEGRFTTYKGMRLVYLPTIASKHLDTFVHTFLSTLHMSFFRRRDAAIYFIAGNAPFAGLSRLLGIPSVINVDGLDSRRAKWSGPARWYIRWAEHNAPRLANAVITDSRVLQRIYAEEHHAETVYIPYGAEMPPVADATGYLSRLGLTPGGYVLFVGRLVPENNAHVLVEAWGQLARSRQLPPDLRLVVVGDAPYAGEYIAGLHEQARATEDESSTSGRILFTGYQFGDAYLALAQHCLLFAIPTEVGGTHPVLVEAMAAGACIVVNDHEPNTEVLGDAGASYHGADGAQGLANAISGLLRDQGHMEALRGRARQRAARLYSWDAVTDSYEDLLRALAARLPTTEQARSATSE